MLKNQKNSLNSNEEFQPLKPSRRRHLEKSETVTRLNSVIDSEVKENYTIAEEEHAFFDIVGNPSESKSISSGFEGQCYGMAQPGPNRNNEDDRRSFAESSSASFASSASLKKNKSSHGTSAPVTYEASEFIAFAMYRLWNPNGPGQESSGTYHGKSSLSVNTTSPRRNAIKRRSTSSISSDSSCSSNSVPATSHNLITPPISTLHPSPKRHKSSSKPISFPEENFVICPHGTESWYRSYVSRAHMLLKSARLGTPFIFLALLYAARLRQFVQAKPTLLSTLLELFTSEKIYSDMDESDDDADDEECRIDFKILTICLMLAQKQHGDSRYSNKSWSNLSSLSLPLLNSLERRVLLGIRYSLHVRDSVYTKWVHGMQVLGKEHALVIRCVSMSSDEVEKVIEKLGDGRKDLVDEIDRTSIIYS